MTWIFIPDLNRPGIIAIPCASSSAGPIKKSFAVYCDIIDEAGGIAAIATILASNNISIKKYWNCTQQRI